MSKSSFSYETSQRLPATLTSEEHEAVEIVARNIRAFVVKSLGRLASATSRGAATRRA